MRLKNPILTFLLCILFGFMALRLIVGAPEGPLRVTPSAGLGESQAKFLHERIVEVATGERNSGRVADLTNFDWDTVCLFGPYWTPPKGQETQFPLFDPSFQGDETIFHMVFGVGGIRNMTARFKRTDALDYDWKGKSRLGCLPADAAFSIHQPDKDSPRYLVLN